jgi:hypothetical protein
VRSFTLEIRHVAFAINLFFGMILGRQAQLLVAEMGPNQSRPLFGDGPQSALAVLRDLSILLPVVIVIVPSVPQRAPAKGPQRRNEIVKRVAESDRWQDFIPQK